MENKKDDLIVAQKSIIKATAKLFIQILEEMKENIDLLNKKLLSVKKLAELDSWEEIRKAIAEENEKEKAEIKDQVEDILKSVITKLFKEKKN